MTAVAVWDHRPEAEELLATRLAEGWTPVPTRLVEGERVLGFACRLSPRRA